jgi:predicted O-methyltransferase YrrM
MGAVPAALAKAPLQWRNYLAAWNLLRTYPAFWERAFWENLRLAREAQARGALQKFRELAPLIGLLRRRKPRTVVEIGTAKGGTLFVWCKLTHPQGTIVSIDLPGGPFGGGYVDEDIPRFRGYALATQRLYLLRKDSHDDSTRRELRSILAGDTVDFLMIDGDHSYEGVKQDFEMYSPLVAVDGVIAFHDILPHPAAARCEVHTFWNEIKENYRHTEFNDPYRDPVYGRYGGIGVLYWNAAVSTAPRRS